MKLALLSDIHANLRALEACLSQLRFDLPDWLQERSCVASRARPTGATLAC